MASVIGLAPIWLPSLRVCCPKLTFASRKAVADLKGRCASCFAFTDRMVPELVSRQRLLVFSEALICLSYSGMLAEPKLASEGCRPGR